jgi:hypothetical protein
MFKVQLSISCTNFILNSLLQHITLIMKPLLLQEKFSDEELPFSPGFLNAFCIAVQSAVHL